MDDEKIIELYWRRDETAIARTDEKYGRLCRKMGWPAAAVTGCAQLLFLHSSPDMLGAFSAAAVLVQSAPLVLSIFFTEKALKKKFGDL